VTRHYSAELEHLAARARSAAHTPTTAPAVSSSGLHGERAVRSTTAATTASTAASGSAVPLTAAERSAVRLSHSEAAYVQRKQAQAAPRIAKAQVRHCKHIPSTRAHANRCKALSHIAI
jgi:hypothetical protein